MSGNFSRTTVCLICAVATLSACGRKPVGPGTETEEQEELASSESVVVEETSPIAPSPADHLEPPSVAGATEQVEQVEQVDLAMDDLPAEEMISPEMLGALEESDSEMLAEQPPLGEATPQDPPANGTAADFKDYEAWFARNGLDLNREGMLEGDPDSDGYSNREEFLADTDPNDPSSHPGFHPLMRLREMKVVEAPLRLEEVSGSTAKVRNTETDEVATVRAGDIIPGTKLKVGKIARRIETDKFGMQDDLSNLTAVDEVSGREMVFVVNMPTRTSETSAELTSRADPTVSVTVRQGEEFQWPGEPDRTYMVIDLRSTQVVVRDIDTGETWTIPLQ